MSDEDPEQPFRKKKALGQHFLKDRRIAERIAAFLNASPEHHILEIGPGEGILTAPLRERFGEKLYCVELDRELLPLLHKSFPEMEERILEGDFLNLNLSRFGAGPLYLTGNFPYSISSPLLVRMVEERERISGMTGMFQKEFADRVRAEPGSRTYGRLSVLLQSFYDVELLFHVEPGSFSPPPKVRSSVIRAERNERKELPCDEAFFFRVVKQAFAQRRKTLRNNLKGMAQGKDLSGPFFDRRAETLSVEEFVELGVLLGKG